MRTISHVSVIPGIPAGQMCDIIGRRLARAISADTILSKDDLDESS